MKKFAVIITFIIAVLCCAFAFSACGGNEAKLAMNKRYIIKSDVRNDENKQVSLVFHSNGTGEYTYHFDYTSTHNHYIIHFKYTFVEEDKSAVVCFYDSLERLDGDDGKYNSTSWSELVNVSKNVLATVGTYGYVFWINEDYLKTIPNFGK